MLAVSWTTVVNWIFRNNVCCTACSGCPIVPGVVETNCNPGLLVLLTTKASRSTASLRSRSISGLQRISNAGINQGAIDIVVRRGTTMPSKSASLFQQPGDVTMVDMNGWSREGDSGACRAPQRPQPSPVWSSTASPDVPVRWSAASNHLRTAHWSTRRQYCGPITSLAHGVWQEIGPCTIATSTGP